jgi:hypothetical protein
MTIEQSSDECLAVAGREPIWSILSEAEDQSLPERGLRLACELVQHRLGGYTPRRQGVNNVAA